MTDGPRLPLVSDEDAPEEIRQILKDWPYALHRSLANSPETMVRWMGFAEHILLGNALPERDREIAIMRVAWNAQSPYEWGLHGGLCRSIGFTDEDFAAIVEGPATTKLPENERALMQAVDEIQSDWRVSKETWDRLAETYDPKQLIDFLLVTAQFMLVAITLNSLALPVEDGVEPFPET
ncbi:MAG: carboxymuconolactone decarboxylase family protein [Alphaproteobacteria bacterium]